MEKLAPSPAQVGLLPDNPLFASSSAALRPHSGTLPESACWRVGGGPGMAT